MYINSDKLLDLWIVISNLFVDVQLLNQHRHKSHEYAVLRFSMLVPFLRGSCHAEEQNSGLSRLPVQLGRPVEENTLLFTSSKR